MLRTDLLPGVGGRFTRLILAASLMLTCAACADLTAIQEFGKMAPDPATVQQLTKAYAHEPDTREDIKLLGNLTPNANLAEEDRTRAQQAIAIQGLDTTLREYMQALGALAGGSIVQSSTSVKDVTTGLTALQKSVPALGLNTAQISVIGDFIQSLADLAESGYRNAKLVEIIRTSEQPFQQLIVIQTDIVSKAIRPSIAAIRDSLANDHDKASVVQYIGDDLNSWTKVATQATADYPDRNPTYGERGAADAHAARYLLRLALESGEVSLSAQLAAADDHIKALKTIGAAHTELVKRGSDVLTKAMIEPIKPLAQEVYKDYQDVRTVTQTAVSH